MRSTGSVDLIHPDPPDPGKKISRCWNTLRAELNEEKPHKASIGAMRLRLQELQETDSETQKIRATELQEGWEEVDGVLQHQGLPYVPEIIRRGHKSSLQ